jgi:hypothetical protein
MCNARECDSPVGPHGARGFCTRHYRRLMRFGDPNYDPHPSAETIFLQYRNPGDPNTCWEWTGRRDADGYGVFSFKNRPVRAHRFAWILDNGPVPDGLHVLHHCDNPPCTNPADLFTGTNIDNIRDKMTKGRWRGNSDPWASRRRLTPEQVAEIRAFGSPYYGARAELARQYGVSHQHIRAIQLGQRRAG